MLGPILGLIFFFVLATWIVRTFEVFKRPRAVQAASSARIEALEASVATPLDQVIREAELAAEREADPRYRAYLSDRNDLIKSQSRALTYVVGPNYAPDYFNRNYLHQNGCPCPQCIEDFKNLQSLL